jgi:signal peptidase II
MTLSRVFAYRWLIVLASGVYAADQISKAWIATRIPYGTYPGSEGEIPVIRGFFYLAHVGNTGAAWSTFTGGGPVLALLAVGAIAAIFVWRRALGLKNLGTQICFGLLCGGILGNLTDRLTHRHVVDFIDLHFGTYIYPTFNVADSGICVGVALYLIQSFLFSERSG